MRYYVTSDTHGFYTELQDALTKKGFFEDEEPHKLIICGDLFDIGKEALKLQDFILELMAKDEIILIRGNHEDWILELIKKWNRKAYHDYHHQKNGTVDTVLQLTGADNNKLNENADSVLQQLIETPLIKSIIPAMVNYYETEHYIFVHGWIPCVPIENKYQPVVDWRNHSKKYWKKARGINGMEAANCGIIEKGKTIVCGHWHCSYGHSLFEGNGGEFKDNPNFTPYYAEGIIALDACTAFSKQVNVIVIEDTLFS